MLTLFHRWIWSDPDRRARKLLQFSATEIDGGRDILRAAELTPDPLLRRLYLVHATDESRHGQLFRRHASTLLRSASHGAPRFSWGTPEGHGLDDLNVDQEQDHTMLAFLHVAERSAASRFEIYRNAQTDPAMRAIFEDILHDEKFHMNYTLTQLVRVSPQRHRRHLWYARMKRLWNAYLRLATALAGAIGSVILTIQYFIVMPLFAWFAKRSARRDALGWTAIDPQRNRRSLSTQY